MKKLLPLIGALLTILYHTTSAQETKILATQGEIICYAKSSSEGTRIYARQKNNARTQSATIVVTYNGFTAQAEAAFQAAVDIWAGLINSPVPIHIDATWQDMESGVLGSASWNSAFANFDGAQQPNTYYPVALAEKIAGKHLNEATEPDIIAQFNNSINWYFGTDGNPASNQFDFISIVLHEIGHGLGFTDTFNFNNGSGSYGLGGGSLPFVYDSYVETKHEQILISEFNNPSTALGTELISDSLFFNSPIATSSNNSRPQLYAPTTWNQGSSIAHLNEATYAAGNINSLMTPQIGRNEVMHDPGAITMNMLRDMGWENTYILHDPIRNTEDFSASAYDVTAIITSDVGIEANTINLHYSLNGFNNETVVKMIPTGNADEYIAEIPSTGAQPQTYSYYIAVNDAKGRKFSKPGGAPQYAYSFTAAVDTENPVITHTPPNFIHASATTLTLEATIEDKLPLDNVAVNYNVNGQTVKTAAMYLIDEDTNLYGLSIDLSSFGLKDGDNLSYSITATDKAATKNTSTFPTTGRHQLHVVGLLPARSNYANNFNEPTNDFFNSEAFSITTPAGFNDGAIHSIHPYPNGTGSNFESNYLMELKVPVIVAESDAFITFDEVVLVEPGEPQTSFGDPEFWDYVIVEGSRDGGMTWLPLVSGYDSRTHNDWLSAYNSRIIDNNSQTTGSPSLYTAREIDLLANGHFSAGDEILIRFRLFADQGARGWGWAIDNLHIQTDDEAPVIRHDHLDYVIENDEIQINAMIKDNRGIDSVALITQVNQVPQELISFDPDPKTVTYNAFINISAMTIGDTLKYKIVAFDTDGNGTYLPSENNFFEVPYIKFNEPVDRYSSDFSNGTNDFIGNFFSITTPGGFSDAAIHSAHPYPAGFGLNSSSNFNFTLKTPITISANQPLMAYDEIVLVEPFNTSAVYTEPGFQDYIIVEGSKDNGSTWLPFLNGYDSRLDQNFEWMAAYNAGSPGNAELYKNRILNLTASGHFSAGDEVLVRFRVSSNESENSWGWAIDNIEIQTDNVSGIEQELLNPSLDIYPNPNASDKLNVRIDATVQELTLSIHSVAGRQVYQITQTNITPGTVQTISIAGFPAGVYALRAMIDGRLVTKKFIKTTE